MTEYILVVTRAKGCIACIIAQSEGFFKSLLDLEGTVVSEVICIEVKKMGAVVKNFPPVFSMHQSFPNFKLMTRETYDDLFKGLDVIDKVYFYNATYNKQAGILEMNKTYVPSVSFENVKMFCMDSITIDRGGKQLKYTSDLGEPQGAVPISKPPLKRIMTSIHRVDY